MSNFFYTLIIYPLVQLIQFCFTFVYRFCKNPGISVIGVSFAVTLFCLPLYIVAERWQQVQREIERRLLPGTQRIKSVFKGDEQYMILSAFYRENHYHPLMALRSSFGLLIQVPFFLAAYNYLSSLELLEETSFLFINDMAVPDALFKIGSFPINILPIAMTLINIAAGAIYTKGFSFREKAQIYGMALLFLVVLYNSPAGLVLYWTMNNILSLVKNIFYKIKNPLKALYIILTAFVISMDVFLIFFFSKSPRVKDLKIAAVIFFTLLLFIPFYIKAAQKLFSTVFRPLVENKALRHGLFFSGAISTFLFMGALLPSLLVNSSVQEFADIAGHTNPSFFVWNTILQCAGLFIFWPACIYFLFHEKIQTLIAVFFVLLISFSITNTFLFPGSYGTMNQWLLFTAKVSYGKPLSVILNLIVLAAICTAIIFLLCRKTVLTRHIFTAVCLGLFLLSAIEIKKIDSVYNDYKKTASPAETNAALSPEFKLSRNGRNVIVFMIDRAMNSYVKDIFEECPWLYEQFKGFTLYKNTVSYNAHTLFGAPPLYGGYEYTPLARFNRSDVTLKQQHNESLLVMPRVFSEQAGFEATIADSSWANWSWTADMSIAEQYPLIKAKNVMHKYNFQYELLHPELGSDKEDLDMVLRRDFLWISFFRSSPLLLRPFIYYDETWWNLDAPDKAAAFPKDFPELDFLPQLFSFDSGADGTFTYVVNELTHGDDYFAYPYSLPSRSRPPVTTRFSGEDYYGTNAAALNALGRFFAYLMENNMYDNTRIIIVSDHGGSGSKGEDKSAFEDFDEASINAGGRTVYKESFHPILLVKDFNSDEPFKTSMEFMTNADVPSIAFDGIVDNPVNPFTGKEFSNSEKYTRGAVVMTPFIWNADQVTNAHSVPVKADEWFTVKENIFDSANWIQGKD